MNRTLLNENGQNTVITFTERPGVEFQISKKEIGRGVSCIVYHAVGSDNTEHLLKEYYPKHLELVRDSSGHLVIPKDKKEIFEQGLVRFRTGCERQKNIRLSNEGLKNFTCNVQGYYAANGTEYIDMTCFNGRTYDNVQEKSVYNLMLRMRTLAQVVGNYHKAGLLHLDIKPENIYVRPEDETIEDVMLFDFDSVTPIDEIITTKMLSCTRSWAAPEQLLSEKRRKICPATDLFAIGEIIFMQLFGRHSTDRERRSFVTEYAYDYEAEIFKDANPKVFPLLNELLSHTICGVVEKRYQTAEELVCKIDEIIKLSNPETPYLKSSLPTVQSFFTGRDEEIKEIHQKLSENNILFLSGIGGIGKSELAKNYAKKYASEYDAIIFAPYISDVNMLLQDDMAIPLYNFSRYPEEKPEEYCARKLRKLQELCDERTLFIVDNLDREDDSDLNKLLDLGCKLLITTRMDFFDYRYGQQLYLDALGNRQSILKIFHEHYTKPLTEEENARVEQIIDLVAGHTMTVELLAKQMMAGRVKPDKMLAKLQDGGISESGTEKVRSGKDGVLSAQSAYGHIQALFDLSELNEDERYILANLSLIPYTGISTELFYNWCELKDYNGINELVLEGWVRHDKENDYISLHPVIRDIVVCIDVQKDSAYSRFLQNVHCYIKNWNPAELAPEKLNELLIIFKGLLSSINKYGAQTAEVADFLRMVSGRIVNYIEPSLIEESYKTALAIRLQLFGEMHEDVAVSYRYLSSFYNSVGQYKKAEEYGSKSLEIREKLFGEESVEYALGLKTLGSLYKSSGRLSDAEQILVKSVDIFYRIGNGDSSEFYRCLRLLGDLYTTIGKYELAEELLQKNLGYWITCGLPNEISVAHHVLGVMYRKQGLLKEAIMHGKCAIDFAEKAYGETHGGIAMYFSSLGDAYLENGNYTCAKDCLQKALDMRLIQYGEIHLRTATSYFRMGLLYENLGDILSAKLHYQKAFDIRMRILGINHTYTFEAKTKVNMCREKLQCEKRRSQHE